MVLDSACFKRVREIAAERGYPVVKCQYAGAYSDERIRFQCTDGRFNPRRGGVLVLNNAFEVVGEEKVAFSGHVGLGDRCYRFRAHVYPDRREVNGVIEE